MKKTMKEIERMLESKGLLEESLVFGEAYDVDGLCTMKLMYELHHKLVILREETKVKDVEWASCVNFMARKGSLTSAVANCILDKKIFGRPYYVILVNDIDAAEAAVKKLFNE